MISIHETEFENVISKIVAILSRPQIVQCVGNKFLSETTIRMAGRYECL